MGSKSSKEQDKKQPQPQQAQQKKPEPAQQIQPPKKKHEDQWIYDYILQYLASPIWKIPIYEFLDNYCILFDDEEENKIEHFKIHKEFKSMIENMVDTLMIEVGIDDDMLRTQVERGLKHQKHKKYFEQLLIVDNFLYFKKLMIKRNRELELEALQELEQQNGNNDAIQEKIKQAELSKEQAEIEHVIAMSLAVEQEKKRLLEAEDQELQEAIRQSELLVRQGQDTNQMNDEEVQEVQVVAFEEDEEQQIVQSQQDKESQGNQQEEVEVVKEEEKQVEPQKQVIKKKKVKKPKQKQIEEESEELKEQEKLRQALKEQVNQLKKEQMLIEQNKEQQEEETIEQRKERLLKQRELLKQKKQKERQAELKKYNDEGVRRIFTNTFKKSQPISQIEKQQNNPLAIDMSEFIVEQKLSTEQKQKQQELQKKKNLLNKIKADLGN